MENFLIDKILEPIAKVIRPNISAQDAAEIGFMFLGLAVWGFIIFFIWAGSNN